VVRPVFLLIIVEISKISLLIAAMVGCMLPSKQLR
jgi:hypothetical protein